MKPMKRRARQEARHGGGGFREGRGRGWENMLPRPLWEAVFYI